jgi:tryptophan halogenase
MEVKSICIVGGGTSGWSMALALHKKLPQVDVTLVESSSIGTIGVGEATQPGVHHFINSYLGLKEEDWMPASDAIYKSGALFRNFNTLDTEDVVHHTFMADSEEGQNIYNWGIKKAILENVRSTDYADTFYAAPHMIDKRKFSKREGRVWYASHLDASKFADFAKEHTCNYINHIIGTISKVITGDKGIEKIVLEGGKIVYADLFIDCSGFKSLLLEKSLGGSFKDMTKVLPNDTALATRIPYTNKEEQINGSTDCQALSSGWAWTIPLWSRIGSGYVYSSKFISEKEALQEFKSLLLLSHSKELVDTLTFKNIPMKVGYQETPWIKNCVAVGLSSQFVEPLESTGLLFVSFSVQQIIDLLKSNDCHYTDLTRSRYNKYSKKLFDEAFQFVLLHYLNTKRGDTAYWRHISDNIKVEPFILDFISQIGSGNWELELREIFPTLSWEHIIAGFNIVDIAHNVLLDGIRLDSYGDQVPDRATEIINELQLNKGLRLKEVENMPTLYQYLKEGIYGNDSDS